MQTGKLGLPKPVKRRVTVSSIETDEEAFQPRFGGVRQNHVASLGDLIKRGVELDPMRLWQDPETGSLIVADGHHRLEAYRNQDPDRKVTVEVYKCDVATAIIIPMLDNAKTRMGLTYEEKANRAWKLTCETDHTKANVAAICSVSARTVANQRRVKRELEEAERLLPQSWREADALSRGQTRNELTEDEREAMKEAAIARADEQFGAALTEFFRRWPEAAMELVQRCAGDDRFQTSLDYLGFFEGAFDEDTGEFILTNSIYRNMACAPF